MIEPLDPDDGTYLVTQFHDRLFAGQMITLVPGEVIYADYDHKEDRFEVTALISHGDH